MAEQDQDRSEPATPFKLREAKRRGQVAKSMEINSLVILSVGLAMAYMTGESMFLGLLKIGQIILGESHNVILSPSVALGLFEANVDKLLAIYWPFLAGLIMAGILGNLFQTGPIFSFVPLKPDVQRLNPVAGLSECFLHEYCLSLSKQ